MTHKQAAKKVADVVEAAIGRLAYLQKMGTYIPDSSNAKELGR